MQNTTRRTPKQLLSIKLIFYDPSILCNAANGCSGHGLCKDKSQCKCHPNYIGADCSQRVCAFGFNFVDTPRGDLNHNGLIDAGADGYTSVDWSNVPEYEVFPTQSSVYAAADGEAHFYGECSGKGNCNRETGQCQCYPGYTGSACQRSTYCLTHCMHR